MTKNLLVVSLAVLGLLYLCFKPQASAPRVTELTGMAMTVPYRVVIGEKLSSDKIKTVQNIVSAAFRQVDSLYNQWNPESEISKLNAAAGGVDIPISSEMSHFLNLVDRLVAVTGGLFDPSVEPAVQMWKPYLAAGITPSDEEVAALRPLVGWSHIHLKDKHLTKDSDQIKLNFDGIAKGFGVDLLVYNLVEAGFTSVFVEWGGEIKVAGNHPDNRPWRVYISGLQSSQVKQALATVELVESALATSGDYHQNWSVLCPDGVSRTYCHIINPVTLQPVEVRKSSIASASVLTSTCAAADALATAAMVLENRTDVESWALVLQEHYPSLQFWFAFRTMSSNQSR
ncbi:MAG: FAD:protein FMN transferase [Chlamydiales bacterium]|nr:FAD:protein FMN transferase [Chlamydiales bacterium]